MREKRPRRLGLDLPILPNTSALAIVNVDGAKSFQSDIQMKAYCINLDRRPDRLAHMTSVFAKAGIPFERVPAVDGQDPAVAAAAALLPPYRQGNTISAGAHGCFESHRAVWRRLVESGEDWAMVLEDDLVFAPDIAIYLRTDWIPGDADIVKLETYGEHVYLRIGRRVPAGTRSLAILRSLHRGTGAYVISIKAAKRLLADTRPIGLPVDVALFDETSPMRQDFVIYQMLPAPVIQGDRYGDQIAEDWAETSLSERIMGVTSGVTSGGSQKIGLLLSLRRKYRIRERLRGLMRGSSCVVVPHG